VSFFAVLVVNKIVAINEHVSILLTVLPAFYKPFPVMFLGL